MDISLKDIKVITLPGKETFIGFAKGQFFINISEKDKPKTEEFIKEFELLAQSECGEKIFKEIANILTDFDKKEN